MKPKITEPQALLLLILFIAFATIMLSRAHGAGGLGNGIRPEDETYAASRNNSKSGGIRYVVTRGSQEHGIPAVDKVMAEDIAFALNEAHSKRIRSLRTRTTGITEYPCCEDNAQAPVCYVCESK